MLQASRDGHVGPALYDGSVNVQGYIAWVIIHSTPPAAARHPALARG